MTEQLMRFPEGFIWGSATAAFQVEGAAHIDGRTDSIWDAFCRLPGAVLGGDDGEVACDQYHRYRDDVALMAELGLRAYRFSTSWARVRPDGATGAGGVNRAGLDYYARLVDALLERDIEPWLTLYHWDLPQALEEAGGWTSRDTALRFVEYAMTVHDALGDRVNVWTTLNEPWCAAFLGYTAGVQAPGRQSRVDGLRAAHHLLLAHGLATEAIREAAPRATLGLALNVGPHTPADPDDPADVDATRRADAQQHRLFLDPLFRGVYPSDLLADLEQEGLGGVLDDVVHDGDLDTIQAPIDILGINYYVDAVVSARPDPWPPTPVPTGDRPTSPPWLTPRHIHPHSRGLLRTGIGWEVQPEGLTRILRRLHEEYTGPAGTRLAVTENGSAWPDCVDPDGAIDDADRCAYLVRHLGAVHEALRLGADVIGYFAWSFLDNFEWSFGYSQRFGIVHVDYPTQRRTVKASGRLYSQLARTGNLSELLPRPSSRESVE
ncbi:GH1 family beta-glucosidase [Streptomyces sp. NPDC004752]